MLLCCQYMVLCCQICKNICISSPNNIKIILVYLCYRELQNIIIFNEPFFEIHFYSLVQFYRLLLFTKSNCCQEDQDSSFLEIVLYSKIQLKNLIYQKNQVKSEKQNFSLKKYSLSFKLYFPWNLFIDYQLCQQINQKQLQLIISQQQKVKNPTINTPYKQLSQYSINFNAIIYHSFNVLVLQTFREFFSTTIDVHQIQTLTQILFNIKITQQPYKKNASNLKTNLCITFPNINTGDMVKLIFIQIQKNMFCTRLQKYENSKNLPLRSNTRIQFFRIFRSRHQQNVILNLISSLNKLTCVLLQTCWKPYNVCSISINIYNV
eukprot:TRINITY_DN12156_c0_g1_i6.p1 TRINITY_DN12156_c0_g1~~TRINITY_DN12156_c0_g1_i6.p1  ORF type:complete len:321 (+),score=-36.81 TRINITY_DN12156_c0_g1_i6:194-1156(+)